MVFVTIAFAVSRAVTVLLACVRKNVEQHEAGEGGRCAPSIGRCAHTAEAIGPTRIRVLTSCRSPSDVQGVQLGHAGTTPPQREDVRIFLDRQVARGVCPPSTQDSSRLRASSWGASGYAVMSSASTAPVTHLPAR